MDAVLAKQIELVRRDHPDWPDERIERVARVWARRANATFWEVETQPSGEDAPR